MIDVPDRLHERLLVLRCQGGDGAAFEELVGRYSGRLRFYLARVTSVDRADDLLQEVWCDVFRSLGRLLDPSAFAAWIYRIARDRAWRCLRQRSLPTATLEGVEIAAADDVPDEAFVMEDARAVRAALDRLAPEHREVLVLRFVEQMKYDQIAAVVGRPAGTVRSRLHYAKRALREALESREDLA